MDYTDKRYFIYRHVFDYIPRDQDEELSKIKVLNLLNSNPDCFERTNLSGHITGSALVVNTELTHALLTHHMKIGKWFQFGGHSDGESNTFNVCLREASEESGLKSLRFIPPHFGIFDIDVHTISPKDDIPVHEHFDIRIVLSADMNEERIVSAESHELKWIPLAEVKDYNDQPSFLRLVDKVINMKV